MAAMAQRSVHGIPVGPEGDQAASRQAQRSAARTWLPSPAGRHPPRFLLASQRLRMSSVKLRCLRAGGKRKNGCVGQVAGSQSNNRHGWAAANRKRVRGGPAQRVKAHTNRNAGLRRGGLRGETGPRMAGGR